jgi:hypothetical protein
MPGSYGIFDDVVTEMIRTINPKKMLDIGTGAGKYGIISSHVAPDCYKIGVEVEESYIETYKLNEIYDEMRIVDARSLMEQHDDYYDLVIIGDCIEHLPKSQGLDLLNFLTYRSQYIIVLAPEFCIQGSVNGVGSESHVSVWSEADFAWHDAWAFENSMTICLFLLRGYLESPISLNVLAESINSQSLPVMDFNRERKIRNANLQLNIRRRNEIIDGQEVCFRKK